MAACRVFARRHPFGAPTWMEYAYGRTGLALRAPSTPTLYLIRESPPSRAGAQHIASRCGVGWCRGGVGGRVGTEGETPVDGCPHERVEARQSTRDEEVRR